jgi:enediyne biosynthesis thioesterase
MRSFEFRHVVCLEETNLVGNVYYVNHLRWQGRCRELFVRAHAPSLLHELEHGLALVTTRVSCEYFDELRAFDEVIVRMYAAELTTGRVTMRFEYLRAQGDGETLVATGEQQVACLRRDAHGATPAPLPDALRMALAPYLEQ